MPSPQASIHALIRRGIPCGVGVWVLALSLALLTPLAMGIHSFIAHPGGAAHLTGSHQVTPHGCGHGHGTADRNASESDPGHSPSRPAHPPHPTSPEDCVTCFQLGLASKCTDVPQTDAGLPVAPLAARLAPARPDAAGSTDSRRASRPRAPPSIA